MTVYDAQPLFMEPGREGKLVADAQGGDREAFLQLVRHYQRPLYRVAYALTRGQVQAAALTQEAFVRAWKEMPEYPSGRRFLPWLLRIGRHLPMRPAAGPRREDAVLDAFAALGQDDQLALALRVVERLRYEEIAELLGTPIGAAFLRISQARGAMLKRVGGPEGAAN